MPAATPVHPRRGRLLINWIYYNPVGHLVEALRLATGFRASSPELTIAILVNGESPLELARCCRAVDEIYAVHLGEPGGVLVEAQLDHIPPDWDHLLTDGRASRPSGWPSLDL